MCTELLDTRFFAAARNENNQPASALPVHQETRGGISWAAPAGTAGRGSSRGGVWLVAALCSVLFYITVNKINEHIFSHYLQSRSHYIMAIISYFSTPPRPRSVTAAAASGVHSVSRLGLSETPINAISFLRTYFCLRNRCVALQGVWAVEHAWCRCGRGGETALRVNFLFNVATDH